MSRNRILPLGLLFAALAILAIAALAAAARPEIDLTTNGATFQCVDAPWHTVLAGGDNIPGGMPAAKPQVIGARCRAAGEHRFEIAAACGLVGFVLFFGAGSLASRRSRSSA
jgi:hypothetical protein